MCICYRHGDPPWILLAQQCLRIDAWDLSPVVITQLQTLVIQQQLNVTTTVRDVVTQPPLAMSYDVITVSYFLERALAPALMAALRPGGLLFYQTFGPERIDDRGPRNPVYRLDVGELLRLSADLTPCLYREEHRGGDLQQGLRGEVMLVGVRPPL